MDTVTPAAASGHTAEDRAREAAGAVVSRHGGRWLALPDTHLGRIRLPAGPFSGLGEWHYWWQAHYLDALVDAAEREGADSQAGRRFLKLGHELLRTIRFRNFGRYVNLFYDDMAWLALSSARLAALSSSPLPRALPGSLNRALASAITPDLGGGAWWHHKRDFKNAAATAPIALHAVRSGQRRTAQELVDWVFDELQDPETGLIRDGLRPDGLAPDGSVVTRIDEAVYTYNQGPILAAALELGGSQNLERAAGLIQDVSRHLRVPRVGDAPEAGGQHQHNSPLITHGSGDGGLFTGILCRYLSVAARHEELDARSRGLAATLVRNTAADLWQRRQRSSGGAWVFPQDTGTATIPGARDDAPVELSTQLQAWMSFEAEAALPGVG